VVACAPQLFAPNGTTDPFSYALSLEGAASAGGYDPLAVHYAVTGIQDNYTVAGAGASTRSILRTAIIPGRRLADGFRHRAKPSAVIVQIDLSIYRHSDVVRTRVLIGRSPLIWFADP
jgi:hypothetical protein